MVKIYNKNWYRNPFIALVCYLRDIVINIFPFKVPSFIVNILYRVSPSFVFLVHPRRSEDIFRALPFLSIWRKFIAKKTLIRIFNYCPPGVIATVKTPGNINALVVSSFYLPEVLLSKNKMALKEAYKCLRFSSKLLKKGSYVGLGALWPVVTHRGLAISKYASKKNVKITTGHCGTLISLNLMIDKILETSGVNAEEFKVAVIGAGEMGSNLSHILLNKIRYLGLIDINQKRLDKLEQELAKKYENAVINKVFRSGQINVKDVLDRYHLALCITSNVHRILKEEEIPSNFIIIDDSRPEAISRSDFSSDNDILVLEGGLIKIRNSRTDYDYGFGIDDNMFGCFAETYALTMDKNFLINPSLGDMKIREYYAMRKFFKDIDLSLGDYKSSDQYISSEHIEKTIKKRAIYIGRENV